MHYLRPRDMHLVLVSSCLLGEAVRHNGGDKRCDHTVLQRWIHEGRVVAVCPEVSGGLPVPRPPAEIAGGVGGVKVLAGVAKVIDANLRDVSAHFIRGAEQALARAKANSIRVASTRIANPGVTAALLQQAGIRVFSESQLAEADALLQQLASESAA
jgi:uncharacterized protein YbbK (DUF523 family)